MRTTWKLLTIAALLLVACTSKKAPDGPNSTDPGKPGPITRPSGGATGDGTYTIKIKFLPDNGKAVAVRQTLRKNGAIKTYQAGTWTETKVDEVRENAFVETLLEARDQQATRFKRKYEKAVRITQGTAIDLAYEGKNILFELAGGQYNTSCDEPIGRLPLANLARDVADELNVELTLIPPKSVNLNETWTIPPKRLELAFGKMAGLDLARCKGTAKLAKANEKDNKLVGVIDFDITLALVQLQSAKLVPPLLVALTGSTEAAIDGSSTAMNTSLSGKSKPHFEGLEKKQLTLEASLELSGRREQSLEMPGNK
jgi:hypothetical protein